MKLIDSHTHTNLEQFKDDYNEVVGRALGKGVWMVNVGTDLETSKKAVKIANEYENGVYASCGIHPNDVFSDDMEEKFEKLKELAKDEKVVGVGETGLDYFRTGGEDKKTKQKEYFIKHIKLARELDKALIVHVRDAHNDVIEVLEEYAECDIIIHFFTGTLENLKRYLEIGCYISFAGVVTFTDDYDEAVRQTPLERMLVETDAPFVTPKPNRGKRNEPSFVSFTAEKLAEIKGISFEELAKQTTENTKRVFKLGM